VVAQRGPSATGHWLVAGRGAIPGRLSAELAARGGAVTTVLMKELGAALRAGPGGWTVTDADGWTIEGAGKDADPNESWRGVVLCDPASAGRSLAPTAVSAAVRSGLEPMIDLAAAVAAGEAKAERLFLVSRGAQLVTPADVDVDPAGATLWGLARTFERELPELPVQRLDLSPAPHRGEEATVAEWLLDPPAEEEVAWRHGRLHARRVAPRGSVVGEREASAVESGRQARDRHYADLPPEYRLTPPPTRSIDDLVFTRGERRTPGPGEVEVRVVASAMNFKDVLNVLGMYPGDPGPLGSESAGVITAVGEGVELPVGTAVMVAAGHGYGRHLIADARMVAPKPETLTFAEAAGLPIAYLTAHFALEHLAGISPSDRVLVHAGAGGVGLAAIAIALRAGAEVYATAGSEWKRALLLAAGVRRVFDSRSASFAPRIMEATGDQGVTIVLNSLADDLIEPTFAVTSPGARFLEIGKRGIWSPDRVAALGKGIEYHVIDWGETAKRDPALVGRLFAEVMGAVAAGDLPPLPVRTFPLTGITEAFRFMAQGRHVGKIVLEHPVLADPEPIRVEGEGAWLITGGTGGLGLVTAEWLADRGARELVLVSRGGLRPENEPRVAALRDTGIVVTVVSADVGNPVAVKRLMKEIRRSGVQRVRGVVHSAGALANRTLRQATWNDFDQVLRAKVHGTTLLTEALTADAPEFFVLYSSIASIFGAPGQANHSAANAFEDAFAAAAWRLGSAGVSIAWGPWSETGAAASNEVLDLTRERGLDALPTGEGVRWLEAAFNRPSTQLVGTRIINPDALTGGRGHLLDPVKEHTLAATARRPGVRRKRQDPAGAADARGSAAPATTTAPARHFIDDFRDAPADTRRSLVLNRVRTRIRRVLGLPAGATIDALRPLGEIGLDSLLAVELRNVLAEDVGQRLPATLLFDYATPGALADHLLTLLAPHAVTVKGAPDASDADKAGGPTSDGLAGAPKTIVTRDVGTGAGGGTKDSLPGGPTGAIRVPGGIRATSATPAATDADAILDDLDSLDDDEIERLLAEKLKLP
jgi:polyketide synthase 12/myxalamid-type polyketide synthase MxaB